MLKDQFKYLLVLLTGLLWVQGLQAQRTLEILSISGQYSHNSQYGGAGNPVIINGLINVKIPVVFQQGKTIWYNNISYLYAEVRNTPTPDPTAEPFRPLQGFIVQTGLVRQLDERHALQLLLAPRLMAGGNWSNADFQPGVIALFEKRHNPSLLMRYGVLYNQDLFGPMIIPLVYLYFQKGDSPWSIEGLLPINSKISYHFNPNISAGIKHFGLITSYPLEEGGYVERSSVDLSLFSQFRIHKGFHLELNAGYALSRDFAQYADDDQLDARISVLKLGQERQRLNPEYGDGFYAGLKLLYLVEIDD